MFLKGIIHNHWKLCTHTVRKLFLNSPKNVFNIIATQFKILLNQNRLQLKYFFNLEIFPQCAVQMWPHILLYTLIYALKIDQCYGNIMCNAYSYWSIYLAATGFWHFPRALKELFFCKFQIIILSWRSITFNRNALKLILLWKIL